MVGKKILILLPDGIGLRNFAYSDFYKIGLSKGFEIIFWNNTPFELTNLGFKEIKITNAKPHPASELFKNARTSLELTQNIQKTGNPIYNAYRFDTKAKNAKEVVKKATTKAIIKFFGTGKGIEKVRKILFFLEKSTRYYNDCIATLTKEKPDFIFCTNHRPLLAIAPLLAAKKLGIPTSTFIFSWDNLPKATLTVKADLYFVWSMHMKKELLFYYPEIKENQILATGTPQFESHFNSDLIMPRETFYAQHSLNPNYRYICFSGDDVTTSPDDPQYLKDTAEAVRKLNLENENIGIVFRRCPVDFSGRYEKIIEEYKDVITEIPPAWSQKGGQWNAILPLKEDTALLANVIAHTQMVINLGSSMAFDYASHDKTCGFINYDVKNKNRPDWTVENIYKYIHFQSMPSPNAVFWLNSPHEIGVKIKKQLQDTSNTLKAVKHWYSIVLGDNPSRSLELIWQEIEKVCIKL